MVSGLIDPDTGMELLDFPDLDRYKNLKFAARDLIREVVDNIVEEGKYFSPEPFMDLKYGMLYATQVYNHSRLHNVEEERLELLRRFIENCDAILKMATQASTPAPQPQDPSAVMGAPPPLPEAPLMEAAG
jgi:hypothetical protein